MSTVDGEAGRCYPSGVSRPVDSPARAFRKALRFTLRQAAQRIGLHYSLLSRLECGKRGWRYWHARSWLRWAEQALEDAQERGKCLDLVIPGSPVAFVEEEAAQGSDAQEVDETACSSQAFPWLSQSSDIPQ